MVPNKKQKWKCGKRPPEDEPGEGDEKPQKSEIEIELPDDEENC